MGSDTSPAVSSRHTFLFPFRWDAEACSLDSLAGEFAKSGSWLCHDMDPGEQKIFRQEDVCPCGFTDDARKDKFAEYQYFYPAVRQAIFGMSGSVMRSFTYGHRYDHYAGATYQIVVPGEKGTQERPEKPEKRYTLPLEAVRLNLYNTGIGILYFQCGIPKRGDGQALTLADIKCVNEYGRRISYATYEPFALARSIRVQLPAGKQFFAEFQKPVERGTYVPAVPLGEAKGYVASFLTDILNTNGKYHFYSGVRPEKGKSNLVICPALDDRMYIHCLVICRELAEKARQILDHEEGLDCQEKSLYELFYVDKDGGCSCQDAGMRKQELEEVCYRRWLGYGSLYGVTHHSFMLLMNSEDEHTINAFLNIYCQLSCLCIAQKASLISLQAQMAAIAEGLESGRKNVNMRKSAELAQLQERYVAFSNQLDFYSVTEQYQGVELYDRLRQQLYIPQARENLITQIERLYETAAVNRDYAFGKWALILAIVSLVASGAEITLSYDELAFTRLGVMHWGWLLAWLTGVSVILGLLIHFYLCRKKKRGKRAPKAK